jgi:hypothetical protein
MAEFTIIPADKFIWNHQDLNRFLIQNQFNDIVLSLNAEGPCCNAIGLYNLLDNFKFNLVTIRTDNPLEKHEKYKIISNPLRFAQVRKPVDANHQIWNQNKIFCAYYGRPLWHRIGIAGHLKIHYSVISCINLRGDYQNDDSRKLFELTELFHYAPEQLKNFAMIAPELPLIIEKTDGYTPGQQDTTGFTEQLLEFYENILIDVVAETFTSGTTFFPTEKTFRPMLMKKPFIVMGPTNFLIYLRQMGFKTFYEFWDEDYDGYAPRWKFQKIIELIDVLSKKTQSELYQMYQDMQPILDHNYELLVNRTYKKQIIQINDK